MLGNVKVYGNTSWIRLSPGVLILGRLKHRMCDIFVLVFQFSAFLNFWNYDNLLFLLSFHRLHILSHLLQLCIFFFLPACLYSINLNPRMLRMAFCFLLYKSCYFPLFTFLLNSLYSRFVPMASFVITHLNSILHLFYCSTRFIHFLLYMCRLFCLYSIC